MKKTFDYKTLKGNGTKGLQFLAGINRSIIPSHVTSMSTSLEKMGIIRPLKPEGTSCQAKLLR